MNVITLTSKTASVSDSMLVKHKAKRIKFLQEAAGDRAHISWPIAFTFVGSVFPRIIVPVFVVCLWSLLIISLVKSKYVIYGLDGTSYKFSELLNVNSIMLTVLSGIVSLTLVFRNSSAYDRYYEGRKLITSVVLAFRNVTRILRCCTPAEGDADADACYKTIIRLLKSTIAAIKCHLHDDHQFSSLSVASSNFLHSHEFELALDKGNTGTLPVQTMLTLLTVCINDLRKKNFISVGIYSMLLNQFSAISEAVALADRIRDTPLPTAYQAHTYQALFLYLFLLPFQALDLAYLNILLCGAAAYTLYGVAAIGTEVMNPFGLDPNDIDVIGIFALLVDEIDSTENFIHILSDVS